MPLSFGTPSQVSLFRHLADPKQVSQDAIRDLKHKASKKSKARANNSTFEDYRSQMSRADRGNNNRDRSVINNDDRRSVFNRGQSFAPPKSQNQSFFRQALQHQPKQEEEEAEVEPRQAEEESVGEAQEDYTTKHEQEESIPMPSYEAEKSQVQTMIDNEVDREKEHFLAELRKYRGQTTREFTMQDTLTDIQFEYDRLKGGENAANVVRIMGIVLQVVVYAVQWGNGKFGPLLKLDNGETSWAMQTAESISNREYDNVLEKLYRKHWRKGSMSPEAELGMMLVGSAGVFHFQTHVNEKLTKRSEGGRGGGKGGGGGFNLMDLVGPVMGLMGGGGSTVLSAGQGGAGLGSVLKSNAFPAPQTQTQQPFQELPPKRFDFVAGRPQTQPQPPVTAPASAPPPAPINPGPTLVEMEQQFARKQQEMFSRLDEVTRRADEQMRASQARQMDLERQLQQTQLRLQQVSQHAMQQQHQQALQQQALLQQQQQQALLQKRQQQQPPPRYLPRAPVIQEESPSPTLSPLSPERRDDTPPGSDGEGGENGEAGEKDLEQHKEEVKFDVKEVMVTERYKRKKAPVQLEIDELSLAL